ncbi:MAG: hypothetical protein CM15mP74_07260 [Halieaceae bacterium]|nr:MAG: hypothetical protein CM15mP74_07260 [Halieaceae bacterium]
MNTAPTRPAIQGSLDALPLFIPALPFAFVFGVVVAEAEFRSGWAGPPRPSFLVALFRSPFYIDRRGCLRCGAVSAALIVGARHMLYSVTLAPKFQNQPGWFRWIGSYVLIDQVFVLSQIKPIDEPVPVPALFSLSGFHVLALWMTCTALGVVLGPAIPPGMGRRICCARSVCQPDDGRQ